ncbi:MAG: GDP-mannose 4,6-dehydratase [archaeon]
MAKTKVLITGVNGFVGSHMLDYLVANHLDEYELHGTIRTRSNLDNIVGQEKHITLHNCDLTDATAVYDLIDKVKPDMIFHYAANSFIPPSWSNPTLYTVDNPLMLQYLLDAVVYGKNHRTTSQDASIFTGKYNPIIFVACTSEEYGLVISSKKQLQALEEQNRVVWPLPRYNKGRLVRETPIRETNPFRPMSQYAVGKVATEMLARQYQASYGLNIVIARCFNQEGPRRGQQFVISDFARQIALIEAGQINEHVIVHGNLDSRRDFVDVRDSVRAHYALTQSGTYGIPVNIGSGTCVSIQDVLDMLLDKTNVEIVSQIDPKKLRPSDVPVLQANISYLRSLTHWQPAIPLKITVFDTLKYWRERVRDSMRQPYLVGSLTF